MSTKQRIHTALSKTLVHDLVDSVESTQTFITEGVVVDRQSGHVAHDTVRSVPFMGKNIFPNSLRPAKSVVRKSLRPKLGNTKSV